MSLQKRDPFQQRHSELCYWRLVHSAPYELHGALALLVLDLWSPGKIEQTETLRSSRLDHINSSDETKTLHNDGETPYIDIDLCERTATKQSLLAQGHS